METQTLTVYNTQGKEVDTIKVSAKLREAATKSAVLYQAVTAYRANQRKGLAATKTRGEVSGGGKKPWRQKGTGRARVGSTRSPLWRHGGVVFGPHPRDFSYRLPQKIRNVALASAVGMKLIENKLIVIDAFTLEKPKTKEAVKVLANLKALPQGANDRILLLLDKADAQFLRAVRNIVFLDVNLASDTHAYEVLAHRMVVATKEAFRDLSGRCAA